MPTFPYRHPILGGLACLATLLCVPPSAAWANQPPTAGPDQSLQMDEDTSLSFQLLGSDPDGDPLSAVITDLVLSLDGHELVDSLGNPVMAGSVVADRQLVFTPEANGEGPNSAVITYRVNDGTQDSANTATTTILVKAIDDPPFPTLGPVLSLDEDSSLEFGMGGGDVEGDTYYVFFDVLPDSDYGHLFWVLAPGGSPIDMSSPGANAAIGFVGSDTANGWPMQFTIDPDQCDEVELNAFTYHFREGPLPEQQGPDAPTTVRVRCINDAPVWTQTGIGDQRFLTASTLLLSDSTPYFLPSTFGFADVDGGGAKTGPPPAPQRVTVFTRGSGTIAVDENQLPSPPIESTPTLLVFEAPKALVRAALATLTYTADAGAIEDTLTILVNDQGSNQGCANPSDGPTCPLQAGLQIHIGIGAGGAPPDVMPLSLTAGGFLPVDTTADDTTTNGNCSLREAVTASNDDVVVDGCPAGNGEDVIVLPAGTYPLSLGVLPITDNATIVGAGEAFSRIDGLGLDNPFELFDTLTLRDVSVIGLDADGDGIRTPIDGRIAGGVFVDESNTTSFSFTDQHLGGTTFGEIVDNDSLGLTVSDAVNPKGVVIAASGSPADVAEIEACSASLSVVLHGGETIEVTCDVTTNSSFSSLEPATSVVGQPVTATVQVAALSVPSAEPVVGRVTVNDGAGASCVATLSAGVASCQLTPATAGERNWTVTYATQGFFVGSADTVSRSVGQAQTTTTILADTPDPSMTSEPVQVDVAVAVLAPGAGVPTGSVSVDDGAGAACVAALSAGQGSCTLTPTVAGTRNLTASYGGDANFAGSAATEPHQVDSPDGAGPTVLQITGTDSATIDDCDTVRIPTHRLAVTFDEPVQQADQASSYLLVAAGPDADLSTTACGAPLGDDVLVSILSAASDLDPSTPTVTLQLAAKLPAGLVRLLVCPTIEDLAGNPLDGNRDGSGGDPFVATFRADPGNLFANGHFDLCPAFLASWIMSTPAPYTFTASSKDADASSLSGSARAHSEDTATRSLAQCVNLSSPADRLDLSLAARLDAVAAATATLDIECAYFTVADCAGSSTAIDAASAQLQDLAGAWTAFDVPFRPPSSAASALCSVAVTADQPADSNFDAYLDSLTLLEGGLFEDGFESGDLGAWSKAVE